MRTLCGFSARGWAAMLTALLLCGVMFFLITPNKAAFAQDEGLNAVEDESPEEEELPADTEEFDVDVGETPETSGEVEDRRDIRADEMTLWEKFKQSGWVGFIILLLEVAVLTLIIEAFVNVNVNTVVPTELTLDLESKLEKDMDDEVIEACYENPGIMTNIIRAGLEAPKGNLDEAKDNIDMAGDLETDNFLHRINFLSVFATIAPMLGLLGTVIGMVDVFGKVASEAALGKPEELARGINMALLTTQYGLMVGIPAMFMYYYFKIRANKILLAVETGAKGLVKWRAHHRGVPSMGLFPNKILLGIEEALSDSFVGLFPFLGFFLGPLSIARGLRVRYEVSTAMTAVPIRSTESSNPSVEDGKSKDEKVPRKLVITPEVSANQWKASAAIFIGVTGIIISVISLATLILAVFLNYNIFQKWFGIGV